MTAAFTPDPWDAVAYKHDSQGTRISNFTVYTDATYPEGSVNNLTICGGYGGLSDGFPDRAAGMANAYLLAAAPCLLHALDYLLEQTVDMDRNHGIGLTEGEEDARHVALAAIAMAHGETYERNQEEE